MKKLILTILVCVSFFTLFCCVENVILAKAKENNAETNKSIRITGSERRLTVREKRGTRCNSKDSLELTITVSDYYSTNKATYDLYTKSTSYSKWEWEESAVVEKGTPIIVHFCKEPYQYEVREK